VGVLCAVAEWGWVGCATAAVGVAILAGSAVASAWGVVGMRSASRLGRISVATALVVVAVAGLTYVFGIVGFLVVATLTGTSPALRSLVRRWWPTHSDRRRSAVPATAVAVPAVEPPRDLGSLDDDALCLAWRRSFHQLQDARSPGARLAVVDLRRAYLDELQRRCPTGLASWLASGARASGNPLPFLDGDHPQD
jgi:hypothetical protein